MVQGRLIFLESIVGFRLVKQKKIGVTILVSIFIFVLWIAVLVFHNQNSTPANWLVVVTLENHFVIMVILVITSLIIGLVWSQLLYAEVEKKEKDSKKLLEIILMFLGDEEKKIMSYMIQNNGVAAQADIARLPNMNRVKAFRILQKMQQSNLIEIIPHGKVRNIQLQK